MRGATVVSKPELSYELPILIDDSITVVIGDLVTVNTDGHVALITNSDERVAGVVTGFVGYQNQQIATDSGYTDRITTGATNTTVARYSAIVDVGRDIIIKMDADAVLAQTNIFQHFNLNNSYQVDVGDASDTDGALQLIKIDPEGEDDLSMGLYVIADHQLQQLAS